MYPGYLIYQAERPLSPAEQRRADAARGELARTVSQCWRAVTKPLRALRSTGRSTGHSTGHPAGHSGGQPAECLPGRA